MIEAIETILAGEFVGREFCPRCYSVLLRELAEQRLAHHLAASQQEIETLRRELQERDREIQKLERFHHVDTAARSPEEGHNAALQTGSPCTWPVHIPMRDDL